MVFLLERGVRRGTIRSIVCTYLLYLQKVKVCGLGYFCATVNYVSLVSIKRKVSVCGCEDPWVD